jgi:hypothetical protein
MADAQQAYANDSDTLANFKGVANLLTQASGQEIKPETVCLIYWYKHFTSVVKYALDPSFVDRKGEGMTGRFDDCINYLELLRALVLERQIDGTHIVNLGDPDPILVGD